MSALSRRCYDILPLFIGRLPLMPTASTLSDVREALNGAVARAWAWWCRELASLLPSRVQRLFSGSTSYVTVQLVADDTVRVRKRIATWKGRTSEVELFKGPLSDLTLYLERQGARLSFMHPVFVDVPLEVCLVRKVQIPAAAIVRLAQVLAIDLERATPFKRGDVMSGHVVSTANPKGNVIDIEHVVLKRSAVGGLMAAFSAAKLEPSGALLSRGGGAAPNHLVLTQSGGPPEQPRGMRLLNRATWASLLCFVLALSATWAISSYTRNQQLVALREEVAALQKRSAASRQQMESNQRQETAAAAPRLRKLQQPMFVAILEEISRILPDQAFLNEIQLSEGGIVLDGQARTAADLVGILSASPMLKDASFAAPITRDPSRGLERFRIKLSVHTAGSAK